MNSSSQRDIRIVLVEGLFARVMYRSLRLMHEQALGGTRRPVLALISRTLAHRIELRVKLH